MEMFSSFRFLQELISRHRHLCSFCPLVFCWEFGVREHSGAPGGCCCGLGKSRRGKENAAIRPILARLPLWSLLPVLESMSTIGMVYSQMSNISKRLAWVMGSTSSMVDTASLFALQLLILPEPNARNSALCMVGSIAGSPYANDNEKELHYLTKEDRLMRWLVVKYRDTKYGLEFITDYDGKRERMQFSRCSICDVDADDENDNYEEEYEAEEIKY